MVVRGSGLFHCTGGAALKLLQEAVDLVFDAGRRAGHVSLQSLACQSNRFCARSHTCEDRFFVFFTRSRVTRLSVTVTPARTATMMMTA